MMPLLHQLAQLEICAQPASCRLHASAHWFRGIIIPCRHAQQQIHGCPASATSLEHSGRCHRVPMLTTDAVIISTSIHQSVKIQKLRIEFRVFEHLVKFSLLEAPKHFEPREKHPFQEHVEVQQIRWTVLAEIAYSD